MARRLNAATMEPRMTPREQFNAFNTLLTKEILRFSRIWVQTILRR